MTGMGGERFLCSFVGFRRTAGRGGAMSDRVSESVNTGQVQQIEEGEKRV